MVQQYGSTLAAPLATKAAENPSPCRRSAAWLLIDIAERDAPY
jgi:hypothetical protein